MKARVRIILAALVVLSGVVLAYLLLFRSAGDAGAALEASGTVEATEAALGFPATGRIEVVLVREGERVTAGQELARLDRAEVQARRQQTAAQAVAARAQLAELTRGFRSEEIAQARSAFDAAGSRLEDAEQTLERTRTLRTGGAVSQEALDRAQVASDVARSQRDQAAEQLRLMTAGPRPEKIEAGRAMVAQADAAIRALDASLDNLTVLSPFDGLVTARHREPGEIVPAGAAVVTVTRTDDRWVRIYVPEDRIGAVRIGSPAVITADTYRDRRYGGEVVFIANEAEFTPKSVQTREERVKLVYAVKVRVTDDSLYQLKPGMPADVVLEARP